MFLSLSLFFSFVGGNWMAQKSAPNLDLTTASLEATCESANWTKTKTLEHISASPPTPLGPSSVERPVLPLHVSSFLFVFLWTKIKLCVSDSPRRQQVLLFLSPCVLFRFYCFITNWIVNNTTNTQFIVLYNQFALYVFTRKLLLLCAEPGGESVNCTFSLREQTPSWTHYYIMKRNRPHGSSRA